MAGEIAFFFFFLNSQHLYEMGDGLFSCCIRWAEVQKGSGSRHLLLTVAQGEEVISFLQYRRMVPAVLGPVHFSRSSFYLRYEVSPAEWSEGGLS